MCWRQFRKRQYKVNVDDESTILIIDDAICCQAVTIVYKTLEIFIDYNECLLLGISLMLFWLINISIEELSTGKITKLWIFL